MIGRKAAEVALNNDLLRRLIRELYSEPKEDEGQKEPLKIYADNKESYFQMENIPLHIVPVGGQRKQFIGNVIILNNVTRYKEPGFGENEFHLHRLARDEDAHFVDPDEPPIARRQPAGFAQRRAEGADNEH